MLGIPWGTRIIPGSHGVRIADLSISAMDFDLASSGVSGVFLCRSFGLALLLVEAAGLVGTFAEGSPFLAATHDVIVAHAAHSTGNTIAVKTDGLERYGGTEKMLYNSLTTFTTKIENWASFPLSKCRFILYRKSC